MFFDLIRSQVVFSKSHEPMHLMYSFMTKEIIVLSSMPCYIHNYFEYARNSFRLLNLSSSLSFRILFADFSWLSEDKLAFLFE